MTVKLYETDSYMTEFDAQVVSCESDGEFYNVVLDRTAFFPEEGGQYSDTGILCKAEEEPAEVSDVQLSEGKILHKVNRPFEEGQKVHGRIDWAGRFDNMQNHTGEHILCGLIHTRFGYSNVGFHLGKDIVTMDVDGKLTEEELAETEAAANEVVFADRTVSARTPESEELKTLEYRSKLDLEENVRLVTIDGCDCCACCAPHVGKTGEVGLIKIVDAYSYKGGMRMVIACGRRALEDYRMLHESNGRIMRLLSAKREETPQAVEKIQTDLSDARREIRGLKEELADSRLETVEIGSALCAFTAGAGKDELQSCLKNLRKKSQGLCLAFSAAEGGEEFTYIISSESEDVSGFVKEMNAALDGRGGGRGGFAQGKVAAGREAIEEFLGKNL